MIFKILLLTLFAVCQAAHREPWWIKMFFPNVSFTGKYHPSNYKVEKSPLFPDYVQNPNDVWSPAYWMPYKQAYSQYWIDLIENATKAEEEKAKQSQADLAQTWSEYEVGQGNQYGVNGQYGIDDGQYGQYNQNGVNGQYDQNGQYGVNGHYDENLQGQTIVQEASNIAEEVQSQAEKMNQDAGQVIAQVNQEAEKQMETVLETANQKKQEVEAQAELIQNQANEVSAVIDNAAKAKVEAIAQETAQFATDIKRQFAPLYEEAEKLALSAAEIAEKVETQL